MPIKMEGLEPVPSGEGLQKIAEFLAREIQWSTTHEEGAFRRINEIVKEFELHQVRLKEYKEILEVLYPLFSRHTNEVTKKIIQQGIEMGLMDKDGNIIKKEYTNDPKEQSQNEQTNQTR